MAHHLYSPAQLLGDPFPSCTCVALVHPGVLQARELLLDVLEHQWHCGAILNIGAVDFGSQHQSLGLDHEVTLAPAELLAAVVTSDTPDSGGPDRLAVDDAGTRLGITSSLDAKAFPKGGMDRLPGAVQPPHAEVVIDRLPGRELVGQEPPLTATTDHIEDGIQDLPVCVNPWPTKTVDRWQVRLNAGVLFIGQVGGIGKSGHAEGIGTPRSYPFSDRFLAFDCGETPPLPVGIEARLLLQLHQILQRDHIHALLAMVPGDDDHRSIFTKLGEGASA